jgi:hypothetical protein
MSGYFGLEWLWGPRKTLKDVLREQTRSLEQSVRELQRERLHLAKDEKATIADMKKMAKDGQIEVVRSMAKNIVRLRNSIHENHRMEGQLVLMKSQVFVPRCILFFDLRS